MMKSMSGRMQRCLRRPPAGSAACTIALVGLLSVTACGGSGEPQAEAAAATTTAATTSTTSTIAATTTTSPTTTSSTTTSSTTTSTTSTTSSTTTTTTTIEATKPIEPPSDSYAKEPVIQLGSIEIPKIGVDMPLYEGIRLSTLDYGPGHWPGSALPGQPGNVVVGGHRTSKHRVFRNIDQLVAGDQIVFHDAAGEHVYVVNRVEIVDPTAIWIIDPTPTPTATLFACHPPGSTSQRIVVFADLAH